SSPESVRGAGGEGEDGRFATLKCVPHHVTLPTNLPLGTLEGASSPQPSPPAPKAFGVQEERERISQTRSNGIPTPNPRLCPRTKISGPTGRGLLGSNQRNTV